MPDASLPVKMKAEFTVKKATDNNSADKLC
jgi:hypothetical protein